MKLAAIDLFCGIGGLTNGLIQAGIPVVAGIDFEGACRFAYETNNHVEFIQRDITTVKPNEICDLYPKDTTIRILAGCAPCQPFSRYSQRYRKDGYKDEKWKLLYSFGDLVKTVLPEVVAMENVPELAATPVFEDFVKGLQELGYYTEDKVVYCPDYGIPQSRKRLILLASLLSPISLVVPTHSPEAYVTVRDAIGSLPPIKAGETDAHDPMHYASSLSEKNLRRIRQSKPGGTWRDWDADLQLSCHKKSTGRSYPSVYGRMSWDEPSPTITSQFFGYGNGRFGHPEQDRAISLREGAILQSFPKDYQFIDPENPSTTRQIGLQIGNAVPVELGRIIGVSILNGLEGKRNA